MRTVVVALLTAAMLVAGAPVRAAVLSAEQLHRATLEFCRSHPTLESLSKDGYSPVKPGARHWALNNFSGPARFDLDRPRQVVVREGKLVGVLHAQALRFGGLPDFGPGVSTHVHPDGKTEMLHLWCSLDPAIAFSAHGQELGSQEHKEGGGKPGTRHVQHARPPAGCATKRDGSGNQISTCAPNSDQYRPDIAAASPEDRALAQRLLDRALEFCRAGRLEGKRYVSGNHTYQPTKFTHHWGHTPSLGRVEFDPDFEWVSKPKMVVIPEQGGAGVKGEMVGLMYVAGARQTFPRLGSIPRPHVHDHASKNPMLHIWTGSACDASLEEAFVAAGPHQRPHAGGGHGGGH